MNGNSLIRTFHELALFTNPSFTTLPASSLRNCSILEEVTLPNQLTTTGTSAIYNCPKLKEIIVPESVTSLGADFLRECTGIKRIIIYGHVVTANIRLGYSLSQLAFLVLPQTITSISHNDAFLRTTALKTIICNATTPPSLANNNLFTAGSSQVIYIPDDCVEAYSSASRWSSYKSRLRTFTQLREEHPDWYDAYVVK